MIFIIKAFKYFIFPTFGLFRLSDSKLVLPQVKLPIHHRFFNPFRFVKLIYTCCIIFNTFVFVVRLFNDVAGKQPFHKYIIEA